MEVQLLCHPHLRRREQHNLGRRAPGARARPANVVDEALGALGDLAGEQAKPHFHVVAPEAEHHQVNRLVAVQHRRQVPAAATRLAAAAAYTYKVVRVVDDRRAPA
eukprot:7390671-Prymnesium_polylepis.1